jgi:NRPS condensation-like uncharacterized protein
VNKNKRFLTMLRESYEVLKFLAKPARPLALPLLRNQTVLNFPIHAFHSYLLNALEFEQLKRMAKSLSVTLNDFLLRDLFVALDQWNCRFNPLKRGQSIRICVPVSLHQLQDQKIPVCNALSYVFLERKSNSVKDSSALLQGIHREMKYYKDSELRLSFLKILTLLGGVKKLLAAGIRFRKCYSSVVFSNWGEFWNGIPIFRKNGQMDGMNLRLDHLEVLSPFRPKTYASFAAISCLGKLVISLHYDSKNFSSDDSKLLLSMYIDQIKKSLADNQILTA